jgi:SNF2 family DNA or RNA helicase
MPTLEVRLSERSSDVLDLAATQLFTPDRYRLQLTAEHLALIAGFDELICLDRLDFTPFDYQIRAAQTVLRRFRGRGLLCDEVGLGKTVEAGLVLKEYITRHLAHNVLILTPPALVEQWREELAAKFGLDDFVTSLQPDFRDQGPEAWRAFPHVIASIATARRGEHRAIIETLNYDLVIIDEAHHLKNRASVTWKFVNSLQKKYLLLLTATPVQNSLDELYNLITLLKPGQLQTPREFQRRFVTHGDPRLPKNRGLLRELLADVMVRHGRGQVGVQLPPRRAHTLRLTLTPAERAFYDDVTRIIRQHLAGQTLNEGDDAPRTQPGSGARRLTLQTLQREIGSSTLAAHSTLLALAKERSMAGQRAQLLALAERAVQPSAWAKAEALEKLLGRLPGQKVLIFTHFRRTLDQLASRLGQLGLNLIVYHGGLSTAEKNEAIHRFETDGQILLSTEAAGEGRNLQFCQTMINFDLPWNPLRIEQRVGRIHRIGQMRPVEIHNLSAAGTIEDYLLDILDRKVNMFELVIGEMDMILGELTEEQDFEELLFDLWVRNQDAEQLQASMEQLGDALAQARSQYQRTREYDEALFGQDFAAE